MANDVIDLEPIPWTEEREKTFRNLQEEYKRTCRQWVIGCTFIVVFGFVMVVSTHDYSVLYLSLGPALFPFWVTRNQQKFGGQPLPDLHYQISNTGIRMGTTFAARRTMWGSSIPWSKVSSIDNQPEEITLKFGDSDTFVIPDACFRDVREKELLIARASAT